MEENDYQGTCTLAHEEGEITAEVVLRGYFQPIDGRFHWYGRLAANDAINELASNRKKDVILRTPHGEAVGKISDPDPWDRFRINGVGRPPFPVDSVLPDAS